MLSVAGRSSAEHDIAEYEYKTHTPFTSTTYNTNDEIRIAINQQDDLTYPCESYLHVKITVKGVGFRFVNNAMAYLFEDVRYELGGVVVDRTRNVGVASTLHNLMALTPLDEKRLSNAGWNGHGATVDAIGSHTFCIPMYMFMGFFRDYRQLILNQKQELILLVAPSVNNVIVGETGVGELKIDSISWRVPHVKLNESARLPLLRMLDQDRTLEIPFRSWELHEYPTLPSSTRISWTVKTSSQLEKPRYVILGFQTARTNELTKDASVFDGCDLQEVKLYLNSQYYPYDNLRGDKSLMYEMYARAQASYSGDRGEDMLLGASTFSQNPIYVIDCSKQNESLKVGPVDVRLEFESSKNFPDKTTAYCLIIHESLVEYSPLTGVVSRVH